MTKRERTKLQTMVDKTLQNTEDLIHMNLTI